MSREDRRQKRIDVAKADTVVSKAMDDVIAALDDGDDLIGRTRRLIIALEDFITALKKEPEDEKPK